MSAPLVLSEIWVYPIKSLGGISLPSAVPESRGLRYDRRWMLVDEQGKFVSQREIPAMSMLGTRLDDSFLYVFWKNRPESALSIPLNFDADALSSLEVNIWEDSCQARIMPGQFHSWFSDQLGQNLRLVYMPDSSLRPADEKYAPKGQPVSFADGFPYLIIGQASLDELNRRLESPILMNRFRPNFVFSGGEAFEEDNWSDFSIQNQPFRCVKPCARCAIPTTDQETAHRAAEPLKTLATFRQVGHKVLFGQNVLWMGQENIPIRVGDVIYPAR